MVHFNRPPAPSDAYSVAIQADNKAIARVPTKWNADEAFAGLTNALQANPDINFLFTSSDFMIPQEVQCLQTAGK